MGQIIVDGLSDSALATLRSHASLYARTVEAEALAILEAAMSPKPNSTDVETMTHQAAGNGDESTNGSDTKERRPRGDSPVSPEVAAARAAGRWIGPNVDAMSEAERTAYFAAIRAKAAENRRATAGRPHTDSAEILREERNKIRWEHES